MARQATIGLIGCGNLGFEFGVRRGRGLLAYDIAPAALDRLCAATKAERAASIAELVDRCSAVVSFVPNDEALEAVSNELLEQGAEKLLHVSCSTVSPACVRRVSSAHMELGVKFVAAPVFARPENMRNGEANFAIAGADAATRKYATDFILDCAANRVFDFGDDPGAASTAKIAGNLLIASSIQAMAEAQDLVQAQNASSSNMTAEEARLRFQEMMSSTIFDCPIYHGYGGRVARRDHRPGGFSLELGLKDVSLVLETARAVDLPSPLASLLRDRFQSAKNTGLGQHDWSALALKNSADAGLVNLDDHKKQES